MNKRLIASVSCAALLLSSTSLVSHADSATKLVAVDAVAAATTSAPAPAKPATPAEKPTTPAKTTTVTTQATATSSTITRLLALGSVGGDVTLLQTLLNSNGYVLKTDGIFGERTLVAVKDYQGKNSLRVDGIVGPKTLAKLTPVVAEVVKPAEPATPVVPAETEKPTETTEPKSEKTETVTKPVEEEAEEKVDAVTSASIVDNAADFEKAISKDGKWIICTLNDLTFDKELVLEGEFKNGKKNADGTDAIQRKIAPYTQDDNKVVLERFTITAPKLTIKSPNARIQGGTFKGDIYVEVPNFRIVDATVEGNIYFLNNEAKETFNIDEKSTIKGKRELINVDATSTASIVRDEADFEKAISKDGSWIAALLKDLTFNKDLTMEGEFKNNDTADRKIGLYSQKTLEDKTKVFTHNFTLTAPRLFIKSPMPRMLNGTFNGNLYVSSDNFKLENTKVNGSIYFTTESAKSTFNNANSEITGEQELVEVDAIASASVVTDEANFEKAISKHGKWIICLESDITTDKELALEGEFRNGKFATDGTHAFDRKIALYTQDDKKNVTGEFTLTTPKLIIKTPKARIQNGTIKGDLYISAPGVRLINTKVEGNVYFTTQEAKDTFSPEGTYSISGVQELKTN
ncbi:peptidoglycan-binding protein [Tissierella carlieri]|jgi:peptidoglycan hydrolase-like protein with peptidoglycan-binding domain|uniref:peptidoglycan-binding domain-containing protein n=1 Tax=Tissierella TaxID=41273 RepID=UPI00191486C5|nr:peptidoglycan-binding domain-containing protein [Tissierella sp. P1]MDU5082188.1 peptidoglycan-binding domain-containing protein [Bacillota bacterium]